LVSSMGKSAANLVAGESNFRVPYKLKKKGGRFFWGKRDRDDIAEKEGSSVSYEQSRRATTLPQQNRKKKGGVILSEAGGGEKKEKKTPRREEKSPS